MARTPFQLKMAHNVVDWRSFNSGLDAFERLSGIKADDIIATIRSISTPEQDKRIISAIETMMAFEELTDEQQLKVMGEWRNDRS